MRSSIIIQSLIVRGWLYPSQAGTLVLQAWHCRIRQQNAKHQALTVRQQFMALHTQPASEVLL